MCVFACKHNSNDDENILELPSRNLTRYAIDFFYLYDAVLFLKLRGM